MAASDTSGALFPPAHYHEEHPRPLWLRLFWVMCQCVIDPEYRETLNEEDSISPEQPAQVAGRVTLALDLDETLIHSSPVPIAGWNFTVPFISEDGPQLRYVKTRPGLDQFLTRVTSLFEVIIFTASTENYANSIISKIDPEGQISAKIFRESCIECPEGFIKDLKRLNRPLSRVILIDVSFIQNTPLAYSLQPENGIPISTWIGDDQDKELIRLIPLLEQLAGEIDVVKELKWKRETVKTRRKAMSVMEMEETAIQEKRCLTDT